MDYGKYWKKLKYLLATVGYLISLQLNKLPAIIFSAQKHIIIKWRKFAPPYCYPWQFIFSNSNFLLSIRPKPWQVLRKKTFVSSDFPPPGYGIPPGYKKIVGKDSYEPKRVYGLYLFPGKLQIWFFSFAISLAPLLFAPLKAQDPHVSFTVMLLVYFGVSFCIYYLLFVKFIPDSLGSVWKKWPIPAYELFLSVPHSTHISRSDRFEKDETADATKPYKELNQYLFWRPDVNSPMWRQSTQSSPDMQSLQELILNLALFEFLFHKRRRTEKDRASVESASSTSETMKIIREKHWYFYLFAPVWVNFFLIMMSLVFFVSLNVDIHETVKECVNGSVKDIPKINEGHVIANFPYNFLFAVCLWFILTAFYVIKILDSLRVLSEKARAGYFNTHLDLIPQQILNELSYIPSHREIETSMLHLRKILGWISSVAFIALMAMLEVLSQPFGKLIAEFKF